MAATVVITKTAEGNFKIVYTSTAKTFEKPFNPDSKFDVSGDNSTITLLNSNVLSPFRIMPTYELPEAWTIDGVTGFTTITQVTEALKAFGLGNSIAANGGAVALNQPMYVSKTCRLTRNAVSDAYDANDTIKGIAAQVFAAMAKAANRGVNLINLFAFTNDTGLEGKTINIVFHNTTPVSPPADYATFVHTTETKGTAQLIFGTGVNKSVAQAGMDSNGILNILLNPTTVDIPFQVWLPATYTPSAVSTYIDFTLGGIQN